MPSRSRSKARSSYDRDPHVVKNGILIALLAIVFLVGGTLIVLALRREG